MTIGLSLATRITEEERVEIARSFELNEDTQDKEITYLIQELRFFIKLLEESLFETWNEDTKNE